MDAKKPGLAMITIGFGKKKPGPMKEPPESDSEMMGDKSSYFSEFWDALQAKDKEAAQLALEGFVACCSESEGEEE